MSVPSSNSVLNLATVSLRRASLFIGTVDEAKIHELRREMQKNRDEYEAVQTERRECEQQRFSIQKVIGLPTAIVPCILLNGFSGRATVSSLLRLAVSSRWGRFGMLLIVVSSLCGAKCSSTVVQWTSTNSSRNSSSS